MLIYVVRQTVPPRMEFNPDFMEAGELVLQTCDRVCFRVHVLILKKSSSVFKAMLHIPLGDASDRKDPVLLQEDSTSVEFMLRCISPNATPPFDQDLFFSEIKSIAEMADKYDMPRVMDFIRLYTTFHWDKALSTASALEMFGLACQWKWKDLVWKSSRETLNHKLNSTANLPVMKIALRENELYALLHLHWARRELLSRLPFEGRTFSILHIGNTPINEPVYECICGASLQDSSKDTNREFTQLRRHVEDYLEISPMGTDLFSRWFWDLRASTLCDIKCKACGRAVYDVEKIKTKLDNAQFQSFCRDVDGVRLLDV